MLIAVRGGKAPSSHARKHHTCKIHSSYASPGNPSSVQSNYGNMQCPLSHPVQTCSPALRQVDLTLVVVDIQDPARQPRFSSRSCRNCSARHSSSKRPDLRLGWNAGTKLSPLCLFWVPPENSSGRFLTRLGSFATAVCCVHGISCRYGCLL